AAVWRDLAFRTAAEPTRLQFLANGTHLLVRADSTITDSVLAGLVMSVLGAIAPAVGQPREEILAITDAQLNAWSRQPGPPEIPSAAHRPWDGRWFWLSALVLLALEALVRRKSIRTGPDAAPVVEQARVA